MNATRPAAPRGALFGLLLLGLAAAALAGHQGPILGHQGPGAGDWRELASNDGAHRLRYRTSPAAVELGTDFDVEVELLPAEEGGPNPDLALRIDGDMPEHGHGLLHDPRTERLAAGRFRARGLRLFMPGHWELYFDVTRGALTERAQVALWID